MPVAIQGAFELGGKLEASLKSQSALSNANLTLGDLSTVIDEEGREVAELSTTTVNFYFKFFEDINASISVQERDLASNATSAPAENLNDDSYALAKINSSFNFNAPGASNNYRLPSSSGEVSRVIGQVQLKHLNQNVADGLYEVKLKISASEAGVLSASCVVEGQASRTTEAIADKSAFAQMVYFGTTAQTSVFAVLDTSPSPANDAKEQDKLRAHITLAEVVTHIGGQGTLDAIAALYDTKMTIENVSCEVDAIDFDHDSALSKFGRNRSQAAVAAGRTKSDPFNPDEKIVLGTPFKYKVVIPGAAGAAAGSELSELEIVAEEDIFAVVVQN
tara:strand:+ start:171 stop:1172 length:1002 start_codon:yes stop_codon:yes gene_type:complete